MSKKKRMMMMVFILIQDGLMAWNNAEAIDKMVTEWLEEHKCWTRES